jgi:hypothetical protein
VEAHERLLGWWAATGTHVAPHGASESAILELEERYSLTLPADFRRYLLSASPREELWDEEDTIWWPLARIRNIPEEYEHGVSDERIAAKAGQYLFFADYCVWCWAWAIACTDDENRGRVAIIGGSPDRFVADSFADFVDRYTLDFNSVS